MSFGGWRKESELARCKKCVRYANGPASSQGDHYIIVIGLLCVLMGRLIKTILQNYVGINNASMRNIKRYLMVKDFRESQTKSAAFPLFTRSSLVIGKRLAL